MNAYELGQTLPGSHYDDTGRYLDYSEITFDDLGPREERRLI